MKLKSWVQIRSEIEFDLIVQMRLFAARLVDQVIVVHHHLVRHARVLFDAIESLSQEAVQIVFGLHVRIQKVNVLELSAIAIGGHNYFTMVLIING